MKYFLPKQPAVLLILLAMPCLQSRAQDFRKFKVGINMGYQPSGFLINLQPGYRLNNTWQVGIRLEATPDIVLTGSNNTNPKGSSLSVNGQYYFHSTSSFNKPYVGLGLGRYYGSITEPTYLGFYPRIGMDAKHFNVNLDYNIVSKYSFVGISLGFFIGGGRK